MASNVRVRLNLAAIEAEETKIGRKLVAESAREALVRARFITRFGPYTTGALSRSLRVDGPVKVGGSWRAAVVTDDPKAVWVLKGTKPHVIEPRVPNLYPLRFFWRKVGHEVRFAYVDHPGQKKKDFLTGPLQTAARKRGMRVRTRLSV